MKLYNDIDLVPLSVFLACFCRHDYRQLVLEGEATEAEIMDAWATLYAQSVDICGSHSAQYVMELQKDIELLQYRVSITEGALKLLSIIHDEQVVQVLKDLKYDTRHLVLGDPKYDWAVRNIESDLPPLKMKLDVKEKELKDFNASGDEVKESTEDGFKDMLVRLGKFQGYRMRDTETTAGEYFRTLKHYIQHHSSKQRKPEPDGE